MTNASITFIGAGNMASALIGGLIADQYDPKKICATDIDEKTLNRLSNLFGIRTSQDNQEAARQADIVVLAVKPQIVAKIIQDLRSILTEHKPLIVSIAAGLQAQTLTEWIGKQPAVVRCMPNIPALVGSGAAVLYANANVTQAQKDQAEQILRAVGLVRWVDDEALMTTVTALSGSGPAYFFLVMEALSDSAVKMGLNETDARLLTVQTALGAARMALETQQSLADLRKSVTSPGGTTEKALAVLEENKLEQILAKALNAADKRAKEIGEALAKARVKSLNPPE